MDRDRPNHRQKYKEYHKRPKASKTTVRDTSLYEEQTFSPDKSRSSKTTERYNSSKRRSPSRERRSPHRPSNKSSTRRSSNPGKRRESKIPEAKKPDSKPDENDLRLRKISEKVSPPPRLSKESNPQLKQRKSER